MKILLAHCRYQKRGGEDTVFDCEAAQLERAGHEVRRLVLLNDSIAGSSPFALLKVAASTVWSRASNRLVRDTINEFLPDIVHFHIPSRCFLPACTSPAGTRRLRLCRPCTIIGCFAPMRCFCAPAAYARTVRVEGYITDSGTDAIGIRWPQVPPLWGCSTCTML